MNTPLTKIDGIWQANITVPKKATELDFTFKDQNATVDDNSGASYHLSTTLGENTPSICKVAYSASNWTGAGGFTANLSITNTGSSLINGWMLRFTFPNGQHITQVWNGTYIQAGSSISLGFNGTWSGSNNPPTAFTLNGSPCATA